MGWVMIPPVAFRETSNVKRELKSMSCPVDFRLTIHD